MPQYIAMQIPKKKCSNTVEGVIRRTSLELHKHEIAYPERSSWRELRRLNTLLITFRSAHRSIDPRRLRVPTSPSVGLDIDGAS